MELSQMNGEELTINFEGENAFLSDQKVLSLSTFDPPLSSKRFKSCASWRIKIIQFYPGQNRIHAEVISYSFQKDIFTQFQIGINDIISKIEKITFRSIDTYSLLRTIAGNNGIGTIYPKYESVPQREESTFPAQKSQPASDISSILTIPEFEIPIKKVQFKFGEIFFEKHIERLNQTRKISIYNENIREEFDAVKNYFAKALERKSIRVNAKFQLLNGEIVSTEATSPEVSKIDQSLVDGVKFTYIKSFIKKNKDELGDELFTLEKLFEIKSNGKVKSSDFYEDEKEFLNDLLEITKTKHYNHLRFLSSKHEYKKMKLRFLIKPFSFIFLLMGENNYHFIWETLDSEEATYIWHFDKNSTNLRQNFDKVNKLISTMKSQGKMAYIDQAQDNYNRIFHDYSEQIDGFIKWKDEVVSYLS